MFCPSCGDDSTANFCPACGSHIGGGEESKGGGGGGGSIGIGGAIVLLLLLTVGSFFVLSSRPQLPAWMRLPRWLSAVDDTPARPVATTPLVVIPETPAPVVPRDPYEELSSTKVELSGYSEQELRVRLRVDSTLAEIEPLLLSRTKDLRRSADVVRVTVYPAGSDGTASDAPVAVYLAADLEQTPLAEAETPEAVVVEPGIFRVAR